MSFTFRITSTGFRFIKIRYCVSFANNTYLQKDFDVRLDFRVEFASNGLFEIDASALQSFYAMQVSWKLYTDLADRRRITHKYDIY